MARRRPNAFDVSFPEEAEQMAMEEATISRPSSVASNSSLGKRKNDGPELRAPKRQQLPPPVIYRRQPAEVDEDEKLIIDGEDPYHEGEDGEDVDDNEKPIRELFDFIIFDPNHRNELVSLDALEQDDGVDRNFEAVGRVKAHFASDEDDGQEEDDDEEAKKPRLVHLSSILRYTVDYTLESEPFYIETHYAWYILKKEAKAYEDFYKHFYTPRRIAQLVISWALKRNQDGYATFLNKFKSRVDIFGHTYIEQDLWNSTPEIQEAVFTEPDAAKIRLVPFVRTLLQNTSSTTGVPRLARRKGPRNKNLPKSKASIGNPDVAVLKAENQNPTHVTPRIADLARGLFREEIEVIGPPLPVIDKVQVEVEKKRHFELLKGLYATAKKTKKIDYSKDDRVGAQLDRFYKAVQIDGKIYNIGDVVLVPRPLVFQEKGPIPQLGDTVDQFFWLGRIQYIIMEYKSAHVEWFYHGSNTVIAELAHPQELFLSNECHSVDLQRISGKAKVTFFPQAGAVIRPEEYFCKFMFNENVCSYTSIPAKRLEMFANQPPPDNCLGCALKEQQNLQKHPLELRNEHGVLHGVAFGGHQFHLEDFVLYKAGTGPAHIGYIVKVEFDKHSPSVTIRKVGRIADLVKILPEKMIKDERHLYLTDETAKIPAKDLNRVIYVPCVQSFVPPKVTLEDWLKLSYNHFYLRYTFPHLKVKEWKQRRKMAWQELYVCTPCCMDRLNGRKRMCEFLEQSEKQRLPALDLFAGVGAFSRGLAEGSGCLTVTHAIEIGPSAAMTFKRNSPDTIVYNQCANLMLRYAIKSQEGHQTQVPKQIYDEKVAVPPPPKPGQIKVIIAGFPCQSHSTLNMFKKADDIKSNLILTTLSYLDFYSPNFAYFENVPGFMNFHLLAERENKHNIKGEIERGGLKLLVRALIDMKYQVRFSLLQAAHYGTPQRRTRFFLVAARDGFPLPELPQPTHDFPDVRDLSIKYHNGEDPVTIAPIRAIAGTAANPVVTIGDAIGDLPRFDWKHPRPESESHSRREERRKRERLIPSRECKRSEPYCGFRGLIGYFHEPKTTFQYYARLEETADIQHYTKCLLPQKVERVLNIPLTAGADYRSLPTNQLEWGVADPMSSVARLNYRRGVYGRLDKNGIFPTTVTNVDPTAKQSQVLHPDCHRMITVRELARSQGFPDNFVFEAIGKNVVTMHRQIGNAVPLPLAHALGREFRRSLFQKWNTQLQEAIVVDDDDDDQHVNRRRQVPPNADSDENENMDIY